MLTGIRRVLRGQIEFTQATREAFRRGRVAVRQRRERAMLDELASQPAQLRSEFGNLSPAKLLKHFRGREAPKFFSGFEPADLSTAAQQNRFPEDNAGVIKSARLITSIHRWPLLGFGDKEFDGEINWHRDPLSGRIWPLDYHADIRLWHNDGSDIRVLWELNRLGHLVTLGQAFALTGDEDFAAEFFAHVESWRGQNPVGRGANWSCAMEVALRAMNLLAAFSLFRGSRSFNEERLLMLLAMFDQHGAHIRRNLEFSYLSTSNHYLSDLAGLLWLAIMLPELAAAAEWREWALAEMLREMDKQILPDGADYEGSTGYHCFVLELFLYTFVLCRLNQIPIADEYSRKLQAMVVYLRAILRPDGKIPLIGDTDGSRVLPVVPRSGNDRGYLLALGASVFKNEQFKLPYVATPAELRWVLGEEGLRDYEQLSSWDEDIPSQAFPDVGTYVQRHDDLYLSFNASGPSAGRPASHRHNDALSIEISAGKRALIVDPGSYVYTADLNQRHLFRSAAYHSTTLIDEVEQNTIRAELPFVIGNEARVRVLVWESTADHDHIVAEHSGYQRLNEPVKHQRRITFHKSERWWLMEDGFSGAAEHSVDSRFHFDAGLQVSSFDNNSIVARDHLTGVCLLVCSLDLVQQAKLETQFTSEHYGAKTESLSARWLTKASLPLRLRWAIVPVRAGENPSERLIAVLRQDDLDRQASRPSSQSADF